MDLDVFGDSHKYGPFYIGPVAADGYTQSLEFEARATIGTWITLGLRFTENDETTNIKYSVILMYSNSKHRYNDS